MSDALAASARRWQRRARLAQVLIIAVFVGGVVYVTDTVVGGSLFHDPYRLTVQLPEAGGLHDGSVVTYRGQRIGVVTDVRLTGQADGAMVEAVLSIDNGVDVPIDSDFEVRNLSAVGEQYIDVRPRSDSGEMYADGATVPLADTSTPLTVPQVLADAQHLMRGLDAADITTIAKETNAIFGGPDEVDLRALAIELETAFALLQELEPTLTSLVENAERPLRTGVDLGPEIRIASRDLAAIAKALGGATPDIRRLVVEGTDLLPRLDSWWRDSSPALRSLLVDGVPLTDMAARHLRGLQHWLDWAPLQADAMAGSTRGGTGRVLLVPRVLKNCVYSPDRRRDPFDVSKRRPPRGMQCTDPPAGTQGRGSANIPQQ